MSDLDTILNYLILNKDRFRNEYSIKKIGIFGSLARNEQNVYSDIDLIVEFEDNTSDLYLMKQRIKKEVEKKFHRPVDICREKYIKPIFRQQIISEAKYV